MTTQPCPHFLLAALVLGCMQSMFTAEAGAAQWPGTGDGGRPRVAAQMRAGLPAPSAMVADIIVSGRTSTARRIDILRADGQVPVTYSGNKIRNVKGFSWWVSKHYALQTDYEEDRARFWLELLELAYPHYVEAFGSELPDADTKRMTVCYGTTKERMRRMWGGNTGREGLGGNFGGGGITLPGALIAYQYPSGALEYHKRYILLHECAHLFQLCLTGEYQNTPRWYTEGLADALSSLVYDSAAKRLTLFCRDKAPSANYWDRIKRKYDEQPFTAEDLHNEKNHSRGGDFAFMHYLRSDPTRLSKLRVWRKKMFARGGKGGYQAATRASEPVFREIFGSWEDVNADFEEWFAAQPSTFHSADFAHEQDGDTLWSFRRNYPRRYAQTHVYLPPGEAAVPHAYRMDYASTREQTDPLLGAIRRGGRSPSIGFLLHMPFDAHAERPEWRKRRGKRAVGVGLGQSAEDKLNHLRILVVEEDPELEVEGDPNIGCHHLLVDGSSLGIDPTHVKLTAEFWDAARKDDGRIGMHIRIAPRAVDITLRARSAPGNDGGLLTTSLSVPIDAEQCRRLLTRPISLLARGGVQGITPFVDPGRLPRGTPDEAAPPNRWHFAGLRYLENLHEAAWHLREAEVPEQILALQRSLAEACLSRSTTKRRRAIATYHRKLKSIRSAIRSSTATEEARANALAAVARD